MARRKVSAVLVDLSDELKSLARLDAKNQAELSTKKAQLVLATEGIFFRAFRAYENFLEDVFILYVMEKPSVAGHVFSSFLKPMHFDHARELLRSGRPFLDWTNPETVMDRAETYVKDGGPIKTTLAGAKQDLLDMKAIRNHIAHNSAESQKTFDKLIRKVRGTAPMTKVAPGEHLLTQVKGAAQGTYYLLHYLDRLANISEAIAEK